MQHDFVKILGSPTEHATTQTHELELPDGATLFLLITIKKAEPPMARMEAVRGVVNFVHHEASKEDITFEKLKTLFTQTIVHPPFDLVAIYSKESLIYIFAVGQVQVFLSRGGTSTSLLVGEASVHGVSGYLHKGDEVIIATNAFLKLVPTPELTGYAVKREFEALEQDSATRVEADPDRGSIGVAFLLSGDSPAVAVADEEETPQEEGPQEDAPVVEEEESPEEVTPEATPAMDPTAPEPLFAEEPVLPLRERFLSRRDSLYEARGRSTKLAVVGILLIVFLSVSIFFGVRAKRTKQEAEGVKAVVAKAEEALSQAKTIAAVNKTEARDLILEARSQVLGVHTEKTEYPELTAMKDALTESLGNIAGVYEMTPDVFSDLTLISQDTKADAISLSDNILRVLSKGEKRVMTIELPGKRTESLPGTSVLSAPQDISAYATRTFVIDNGGLYEFGNTQKKQLDLPGDPSDLLTTSFAGNIYILQKSANAIWRYPGSAGGFGEKSVWLSEGVSVDFSKASSIAVDGAIWVLSESGKVVKFMTGNPQNVNLHGLPASPSSHAALYTDDTAKYVYVLDPEQESVFVFEKTGELIATYSNSLLKSATNIVVSEENNIMVLSAGSRILSLPTKHLQ